MLGDTAVAVNPEDERYKELIGKTLNLPLTEQKDSRYFRQCGRSFFWNRCGKGNSCA